MRVALTVACLIALSTPALAQSYPVSGRYGVGAPVSKDPVDCSNLRVIAFNGDTRTDSRGGVPAFRLLSVSSGSGASQIVEAFNTGQINARAKSTLRQIDANHVELDLQPGGLLKLQRCK